MQMSTFLQFQSGTGEVLKTDVAVHSGIAAAWAEPLQLQALDNRIVVRYTETACQRDRLAALLARHISRLQPPQADSG